MLKKKYINSHKSILINKYLINNSFLKFILLKKINFFFLSMSKKENLSIFKNIYLALSSGKSLYSKYAKLHINQRFTNLSYVLSLTKSYYSVENFYLVQKLFIPQNYLNLSVITGNLTHNTFLPYLTIKPDSFSEQYLVHEQKYISQNTYVTQQFYWMIKNKYNFSDYIFLSLKTLFIFDLLNLWSLPYYGLYLSKSKITNFLTPIK